MTGNVTFIGDEGKLLGWCFRATRYVDRLDLDEYDMQALAAYRAIISSPKELFVRMTVAIGTEAAGTLVFRLEPSLLPRACERFMSMLVAEEGSPTYVGTALHRIVPGGWMQGGVVPGHKDMEPIADECFSIQHDKPGVIGFVNDGPHTNRASFYVTFAPLETFDQKYQAFGCLVDGLDVLRKIDSASVDSDGHLRDQAAREIRITAGGRVHVE